MTTTRKPRRKPVNAAALLTTPAGITNLRAFAVALAKAAKAPVVSPWNGATVAHHPDHAARLVRQLTTIDRTAYSLNDAMREGTREQRIAATRRILSEICSHEGSKGFLATPLWSFIEVTVRVASGSSVDGGRLHPVLHEARGRDERLRYRWDLVRERGSSNATLVISLSSLSGPSVRRLAEVLLEVGRDVVSVRVAQRTSGLIGSNAAVRWNASESAVTADDDTGLGALVAAADPTQILASIGSVLDERVSAFYSAIDYATDTLRSTPDAWLPSHVKVVGDLGATFTTLPLEETVDGLALALVNDVDTSRAKEFARLANDLIVGVRAMQATQTSTAPCENAISALRDALNALGVQR